MGKGNFIKLQYMVSSLVLLCLLPSSAPGDSDAYAIISKKNLFRPDRSEWISNKHTRSDTEAKTDPEKLELFGTIIIGDSRSALIYEEKKAERKKSARSSSARSSRSRVRKKAKLYRPGDYLGSYIVSDIDEKRVVLDYYGDKEILYLHEGKEPPQGDYTPLEVAKPQPKVPAKQKNPDRQKVKTEQRRSSEAMAREIASGKVPAELAQVMSPDQLGKLLRFNRTLMKELKEGGGSIDQYAIKEKVEAFRQRFLESM